MGTGTAKAVLRYEHFTRFAQIQLKPKRVSWTTRPGFYACTVAGLSSCP